MKIVRNVAAVAAIMILPLCADVVNLVQNPDFEQLTPEGKSVGWEKLPSCFKVIPKTGENGSSGLVWENHDPKVSQYAVQRLKLEPGRDYRLSMRVKTEGLTGGNGGASIRLFWYKPDGKFLKETFVPGIKSENSWATVEWSSVKMPKEAGAADVAVYMNSGFVGKAYFDSVSVTRVEHRPVAGMWSDAYRDSRAAGKVTFVTVLELEDAGLTPAGVAPQFVLPAANGTAGVIHVPDAFSATEARITLDVSELPLGDSPIGFRMWNRTTGKLVPDAEALLIFNRPATEPTRKVAIDSSGRAIVDGKRFFPLGMFINEKVTPELISTYCEGPFNCVMNYRHADLATLDLWHRSGIKVIYPVQSAFVDTELEFVSDEGADRWFADTIRQYCRHPAILAWYLNDERGLDYMPRLRAHQRLAHALDPDHPTWSVLYQVPDVSRYLGTFDVIGSDPYPIGNSDDLHQVWNWTVDTLKGCRRLAPAWQVPQSFDWGAYWADKVDKTRMPTRDEMACMGWTAIAGGANGLVWYSFTPLKKMEKKMPFAKSWADVKSAAAEIAKYQPIFLLDDAPEAVTADQNEVKVRAWKRGERLYVLAVNLSRESTTAAIKVNGVNRQTLTLAPIKAKLFPLD